MAPVAALVTEDDLLRSALEHTLGGAGWRLEATARDRLADAGRAACVILDLGSSSLDLVRACQAGPAVLVFIEASGEDEIVRALEAGADDCLGKPLRAGELVARLAALTRRSAGRLIERGRLRIDRAQRAAWVGERQLRLTPTELGILEILARDPGRAFHRMDLLRVLFNTDLAAYARNVDCHVTRLRRKLEAAGLDPAPIATVQGMGYRFQQTA